MRTSTRMTFAAGWAAALGAVPLGAVFEEWDWLWFTWAAVAAVVGAHLLARSSRLPTALVPLAGALGLLLYLNFVFAADEALLGLIPTPSSLQLLADGLESGLIDVHDFAAPVPPTTGLKILTAASVGGLTILLDVIAVVLRHPAAAGLALLGLYAVPTAVAPDGVKWPLFVIGALGYLVLLMVEGRDRLLRWGRPVAAAPQAGRGPAGGGQLDDDTPMPLTGQRIGATALAIAVVAPLFVPGLTADALSSLGRTGAGSGSGRSGGSVAINPFTQLQGRLTQPTPTRLFRVETQDTNVFYLRTMVLGGYTSRGWERRNLDAGASAAGLLDPPQDQFELSRERQFTVKVSTEAAYSGDSLPLLYYPTDINGVTSDWHYDSSNVVLQNPTALANSQVYTVEGFDAIPSEAQLQNASGAVPEAIMRTWSSARNVPDEVRQIVSDVTRGATTPYERARALNDYFRNNPDFLYSTQTQPGNSGSALLDFLRKKRGYCEQYASALGIMLRVADIPSRVVLGFLHPGGGDGSWDISTSDAHAWVEAYFPGVGWAPFDPTPRDYSGRIDPPYAPGPAPSTTAPGTISSAPGGPTGPGRSGQLEPEVPVAGGDETSGPGLVTPRTGLITLGVVVILALLLAPTVGRRSTRRRRLRLAAGGDPRAAALAAWDEVLGTAADCGVPMPANETPRGTGRRLATELADSPPAVAGLRLLALAEERARYAPQAGVEGDLPTAVRAVNRGLRDRLHGRRRLLTTLFPHSTVQAIMTGAARRTGEASAAAGRLAGELRRLVPRPRRLARSTTPAP